MSDELATAEAAADRAFNNLRWSMQAREARIRAARRPEGRLYIPRKSRNALIRDEAILREPIPESRGAAELWITYNPGREEFQRLRQDPRLSELLPIARACCDPDALNGYVAFDKRRAPRLPKDCPLTDYIPVHGGITYRVKDSVAAVWGFDTLHAGSECLPRTDQVWMRAQSLLLYEHLVLCEKYWPEYHRAGRARRIEIVTDLFGHGRLSSELGVDAMLRLMSGDV